MGCADEQTSSKGFQAVKPTVWGGVQESVLFLFLFMTEESKENPPPGGYGNDERDDTDRQRVEEAPVSRLEMETWEREGRVEMEKWERHVANEFKEGSRTCPPWLPGWRCPGR